MSFPSLGDPEDSRLVFMVAKRGGYGANISASGGAA